MSACKQCRFSGVSLRSGTGITAAAILIAAAIAAPLFAQTDSGLASNLAAFNAGLNGLIAEVRTNNPQLKAAGYRTEAARAAAGFQKFLDPPLLGIDFFQTPLSSFPDPIGRDAEIDYSIQQMFPFPGKLSSMASAEQSRSAMYGADAKTLEQVIIRDCKMAWFEIYLIDRRLQVNAENQGLLKSFIGITRRQYEVGRGTQADILRGQTELSTLETDALVLHQERRSAEAMIDALRGGQAAASVGPIAEIVPPVYEFAPERLDSLAMKNRPELMSMHLGIVMQGQELAAARREFYPDFMVRGVYKQMKGMPDNWELMLGMTLPVAPWSYGKYASGAARASFDESRAREEAGNMINMVRAQVRTALVKIQSAGERMRLYRSTVVPQARATLQSAIAGYQNGKEDFLGLIDARRTLLMAQQDYHMAVMSLLSAQAELEKAVGVNYNDIVLQTR